MARREITTLGTLLEIRDNIANLNNDEDLKAVEANVVMLQKRLSDEEEKQTANTIMLNELKGSVDNEKESIKKLQHLTYINLNLSILSLVLLICHDPKRRSHHYIKQAVKQIGNSLALDSLRLEEAVEFCVKHCDLMNFELIEDTGQIQLTETPKQSDKGIDKKG